MKIKLGISLVLAFLVFIFISQNTEFVRVEFLSWSVEMTIVLLVFIILGIGIIIGWLLNSYLRFVRNRKQVKTQVALQAKESAKQEAADVAMQGDKQAHG
ncbi:MAG: DUF1049 domain-containing protein [Desulfuromonadales bacterium]|nr:DUF1049 domain-containing protein [Desulfuromonadales bacterium]